MKRLIVTETKFNKIFENQIVADNDPNTMSFWHGGNLENYEDVISQKSGRFQYGPGLYLTTKYDDAIKYSKGSRKLYLVTVYKGNEMDNSSIDFDNVILFIKKYVIKSSQNEIINALSKRVTNNTVPSFILNNLIINFDAIKPGNTKYLRQFYIDNGIDYNIVDNAFGWHEKMMVLFNMKKIKNIQVIRPNDKIDYNMLDNKKAGI